MGYCRVSDPHFFFADPDPDPGGIRGRGLGVKGKNDFFFFWVFFTFQMILNNGGLKSEQKKWNCLHCTSPTLQNNDLFIHFLTLFPGSGSANLCGSGQGKNIRILRIRIRNPEIYHSLMLSFVFQSAPSDGCADNGPG